MWPWGLHLLRLPGTPTQTCLPSAGGPAPLPRTQEWCACPCVRSCVRAHVAPAQIGSCPRPVRRWATSKILPDFPVSPEEESARGSLHQISGPLLPIPRLPAPPIAAWSPAWSSGPAPGLYKRGRGCDLAREGLRGKLATVGVKGQRRKRRLRTGYLVGDPNSGQAGRVLREGR